MDLQVDASQRKFAKPELAYGRAMGGQTNSQVGSRVHASCKKVVNFTLIPAYEFELDRRQHQSTQVDTSEWPNETKRNAINQFHNHAQLLKLEKLV